MNYILYEHSGSGNHGCEAIVRSTAEILGITPENAVLYTFSPEQDTTFGIDKIVAIRQHNIKSDLKRNSPAGIYFRTRCRITGEDYDTFEAMYPYRAFDKDRNTVALSIGGDNYCYKASNARLVQENKYIRKHNKTVLWGCSLDKAFINDSVKKDLSLYDLITVRESLSGQLLGDIGIYKNVIHCADPAFTLPFQPVHAYDSFFADSDVIGLNLSALMKHYEPYKNAVYDNFSSLIRFILENTERKIILIPHVNTDGNSDYELSVKLEKEFDSQRLITVSDTLNCMELKYVISKCKAFVGCRTHATIAAYSTGVPTLVIGYSTKSLGICTDLFGSYDGLVVPVKELTNSNGIIRHFSTFSERETELRNTLTAVMPKYISTAYNAKETVMRLKD